MLSGRVRPELPVSQKWNLSSPTLPVPVQSQPLRSQRGAAPSQAVLPVNPSRVSDQAHVLVWANRSDGLRDGFSTVCRDLTDEAGLP